MEDFFKQFRQNLDNRPEPPFEERDWRDMEKRLDRANNKRPAGFAWWWAAVPLLLLGSNVLLYDGLRKANQRIATLEWQRDTVVLTNVVRITDTIFRARVERQTIVVHVREKEAPPFIDADAEMHVNHAKFLKNTPSEQLRNQKAGTGNQSFAEELDLLETASLSLARAEPERPEMPAVATDWVTKKRKKTFRRSLHAMRPKGFQLGFSGGWAYPFSNILEVQSGVAAGLQAMVEFSPNLQMWAEANWVRTRFETGRMGDDIGVPVVDAPSDDFQFVKAEAPQPSLQYSVGMQYLFRAHRKWKPAVGVGYGAVALLPYEVVYEFENKALGVEWNFDKPVNHSELLTDFLLLRLGLEHRLSTHWNGQLGVVWRTHLGKRSFYTSNMFSLQAGFRHRF